MTRISFLLVDGTRRTIDAADSDSVMRTAVKNDVPGIEGECGGALSCGTCHIYVESDWSEKVDPQSEDERELLEMMDGVRPESRLGCQITVRPELEGFTATISKYQ